MEWKKHKQQLLKHASFRRAFGETELEFEIAKAIIDARIHKGFTQADLAKKLQTKQSVISRVENARTIPSLSFLKKVAVALDQELQVEFKPL